MITEQIIGTQSIIPRYIALTKPRIIILLVFTALSGMFLAAEGTPDFLLLLSVMVGGALAAGGANALTQEPQRLYAGSAVFLCSFLST